MVGVSVIVWYTYNEMPATTWTPRISFTRVPFVECLALATIAGSSITLDSTEDTTAIELATADSLHREL